MNTFDNKPLTPDEQAITDYLSGVLKNVPPIVAPASEDRARLEELMQLRAEVGEASIATPDMTTTFSDVIRRAGKARATNSLLDAMSSRWGFRLTAAAALFLVVVVGTVSTQTLGRSAPGGIAFNGVQQTEQFPVSKTPNSKRIPAGYVPADKATLTDRAPIESTVGVPGNDGWYVSDDTERPANTKGEAEFKAAWGTTMIRKGSLGLRHEDPAAVQRKITDELTVYGGTIVNLNRSGVGENTNISMEVTVPSEKYGKFVATLSSFGEVISQNESAQEAVGEIIDNEASLSESRDYLKRLDALADKAGNSIDETRRLEGERRQVRRDIERFQRALDKLKERTSMATLNVSISTKRPEAVIVAPPTPFQKAMNDGLDGLVKFTATLMQIALVTLPLSIPLMIFLVFLLRRRRKVPYAQ